MCSVFDVRAPLAFVHKVFGFNRPFFVGSSFRFLDDAYIMAFKRLSTRLSRTYTSIQSDSFVSTTDVCI